MTDQITRLLDQIDRLDKDVTPGPWAVDKDNPRGIHDPLVVYPEDDGGVIAYVQPDHDDAEFIALARTFAPAAAKALRAVLELHTPQWSVDLPPGGYICAACNIPVESEPCPTIQAIHDAIGDPDA